MTSKAHTSADQVPFDIPVLPSLREDLDLQTEWDLAFHVTEQGKSFTAAGFGDWFRDRCDEAGLCTVLHMDFDRQQQRVSPTMARRRISSCPGLYGAL